MSPDCHVSMTQDIRTVKTFLSQPRKRRAKIYTGGIYGICSTFRRCPLARARGRAIAGGHPHPGQRQHGFIRNHWHARNSAKAGQGVMCHSGMGVTVAFVQQRAACGNGLGNGQGCCVAAKAMLQCSKKNFRGQPQTSHSRHNRGASSRNRPGNGPTAVVAERQQS